jgi:DNA-binding Lrp family transcriptional regulator
MKDICPYEIDFYVLQALRNNSRRSEEEVFREVKKEIPEAEEDDLKSARERAEGMIKRYTAVVDPLLKGLIPFYSFINVRENFRFVTDSIKENIGKVSEEKLVAVYDLIGKPDFMIIGLTEGVKGRMAEEYIHDALSRMGGEEIHNYLTTQVEIPRSIKKFWNAEFDISDFEERAGELKDVKYDPDLLKSLQEDCRKVEAEELEERKIVRGYSIVMDPMEYPSRHWNFLKAFIQVDALFARFEDLYILLEEKFSKEVRGVVQIPYSRYGILVECEVANVARLKEIMGTIRNQDYVRTTRTAVARDVIFEDLWVI